MQDISLSRVSFDAFCLTKQISEKYHNINLYPKEVRFGTYISPYSLANVSMLHIINRSYINPIMFANIKGKFCPPSDWNLAFSFGFNQKSKITSHTSKYPNTKATVIKKFSAAVVLSKYPYHIHHLC